MRHKSLALLLTLAVFCLVGWAGSNQATKRTSWDYKNLALTVGAINAGLMEDGKKLAGESSVLTKCRSLGDEGWELVSVTSVSQDAAVYWFKRLDCPIVCLGLNREFR